jgi:hypothetical protein
VCDCPVTKTIFDYWPRAYVVVVPRRDHNSLEQARKKSTSGLPEVSLVGWRPMNSPHVRAGGVSLADWTTIGLQGLWVTNRALCRLGIRIPTADNRY